MGVVDRASLIAFLYTADMERCLHWYEDVLGLQERNRDDHGAELVVPGRPGAMIRVTALPAFNPSEHPVLGWNVPDLSPVERQLREAGVRFTVYDGMGQNENGVWTSPDGKTRLAWFPDPDGNILMLTQAAA